VFYFYRKIAFKIFTLTYLITGACYMNFIKGSGNIITEDRTIEQFDEISLRGSGTVILTQGDIQNVSVTTDDNIMDLVVTEVKNNRLIIYTEGNIIRSTQYDIDITIPEIESLHVSGSGDVVSNETIVCDDIDLSVSGSGEIELLLQAQDIYSKISGSGEIELEGNADELEVKISGSGNLNAKGLNCEDASVKVSGSGNCKINAIENLNASVSGSGNVYYYGNPDISTSISGSGSVQKRNL